MSQSQELANQAERLLTATDVTIIGVLLVIVIASWVIIYKIWSANKELNKEIRNFIEKYYVLSTKILGFLSKGKDV
jgi:Tfp pilus assembly protein PilE